MYLLLLIDMEDDGKVTAICAGTEEQCNDAADNVDAGGELYIISATIA